MSENNKYDLQEHISKDINKDINRDINKNNDVLRVSSRSVPNSVAGAMVAVLRDKGKVELQAIGAGAINQAVKAIAIGRGFAAPCGIDLICIPAFSDTIIDGQERTAIKFIIEAR